MSAIINRSRSRSFVNFLNGKCFRRRIPSLGSLNRTFLSTESNNDNNKGEAPMGGGYNEFNLRKVKERLDAQKLERIKHLRSQMQSENESQSDRNDKNDRNVSNESIDNNIKNPINSNGNDSETRNEPNKKGARKRKKILITGANGNLGAKLLQFWRNTHELVLLDCAKPSDLVNYCLLTSKLTHSYVTVDLLHPRDIKALSNMIRNVDCIVHLAAQNPFPDANWDDCVASIDMTNRVLLAAYDLHRKSIENEINNTYKRDEDCRLTRVIYASSNHIMGGYRSEGSTQSEAIKNGFNETASLEPSKVPMFPGTSFMLDDGFIFDSTPYAMAKVAGERLCLQSSMNSHNHLRSLIRKTHYNNANNKNENTIDDNNHLKSLEHIVVRIGWCQPGENLPNTLSATGTPKDESLHKNESDMEMVTNEFDDRESVERWFRNMWLSNIDLFRLFETCVQCELDPKLHGYSIVNGVSRNSDSRWNVDNNDIGFNPIYDVNKFDPSKMPVQHVEQNKVLESIG